MKAEEVVDAPADRLTEVEAETLSDTLAEVKTEALVDALPDWPIDVEAETLGDTLADVNAKAQVHCCGLTC